MFRGCYTAIVTPFNRAGGVDYGRLRALIDMQFVAGVDGIVPVGTTGESPTLNMDEHRQVITAATEAGRGRLKVIAGTGGNATAEAIELTRHALSVGADATLQVTPYYNKPSQEGLYRHFSTIADLGLPVVLYNVPTRTACEIAVDTVVRLAAHPKIVAIKDSPGPAGVDRTAQITGRCGMTVLSGDDSLTLPMMVLGAKGAVSVASNVAPKLVADMVRDALAGRWAEAHALHARLHRLFTDLFIETNPVPVKAALAMMGLVEEEYRLPLCPMSDALKNRLLATLKEYALV